MRTRITRASANARLREGARWRAPRGRPAVDHVKWRRDALLEMVVSDEFVRNRHTIDSDAERHLGCLDAVDPVSVNHLPVFLPEQTSKL